MTTKISTLPDFAGRLLLLEAQQKGIAAAGPSWVKLDATALTLIGLAALLVERGVLEEKAA